MLRLLQWFQSAIQLFVAVILVGLASVKGRQDVTFTIEPQDQTVILGHPAILNCQVLVLDDSNAQVFIRWRGEDPASFFDHRDNRRSVLSNGSLYISQVSMDDQGIYQCVGNIDPLGSVASRLAKLQVIGQLTFVNQPQDLRVFAGQTAHFSCLLHGFPHQKIIWLKDDRLLHIDSSRMLIMPSGSLEIDKVRIDDQGIYRCNVSTAGLYKLSNKAVLTINTDSVASAYNIAPIFITKPRSAVVEEGQTLTLDCAANGNPRPWLVWLKDGVAINMSDTRFVKLGTGSLQISDIQEKDSGNYQCRAGNPEDSVDASATVAVQVPPRFIRTPQDTIASEKEDLELTCQVYGKPEPKIQWYKNSELITVNDYIQFVNGYNLKILGLMQMDAGVFQCMAFNSAGNIQTAAKLVVRHSDPPSLIPNETHPHAKSSLHLLESDTELGDPDELLRLFDPVQLELHKGSRQYFGHADGRHKMTENSSYESLVTPSAPQNIRADIVSSRFITLSWERPAEPRGEILWYSIYYRLEGTQRERLVNTSGSSVEKLTVQNLQPGRLYHFRIIAYNELGPGAPSEDLKVSTGGEDYFPGPPLNLNAYATSPTSIFVEWKPPAYVTEPLKYKLFYMKEESTEDAYVVASDTFYELTDLKKYTKYLLWVIPYNSNDSASEDVSVRTLSDLPSAPPMNVSLEPASATSIIVRWDPPPKEEQNGVITGYKLRCRKQNRRNGLEAFTLTAAGDRRLYVIPNLERGTAYQVRISAMNINGTGPSTEWYTIETYDNDLDETQVPGEPNDVIARPSSSSIRLSWNAPKDTNVMVRGYTIGWGKGIPDVYTKKIVEGKQRFFTIEDLQVNSEYVISVRAYNDMGDGPPSYVSVWTREEQPPEPQLLPPVGLKAIVLSSSTVVLYWTDPTLPKSQMPQDDRYYSVRYTWAHHTSSPRPRTLNVTELNCMITDLRPNTMYEFSVKLFKGRRQSGWSMVVHNTTEEAPPSSAPRDLTVVPVEGNPAQINLNWQPPKPSNGPITGYVIFYTTDENIREKDWVVQSIMGDKLTAVVKGLKPGTTYYIKIQAKNSKGFGPLSNKVVYTTPAGSNTYESNIFHKDAKSLPDMFFVILGCALFAVVCVTIIIAITCCKRAQSRRRNNSYLKGNLKVKTTNVKPPDLWIHHDQMELKAMEKSHHSSSDIGPSSSGSQMNTLVRASSTVQSDFDHSGSLDKRTYLPSYVGTANSNPEKTSTIKRSAKPKPISLPMDSTPVSQPVATSVSSAGLSQSPGCELARPLYPRTQYRAHLAMDTSISGMESPYALQAGYDSVASVPPMQHIAPYPGTSLATCSTTLPPQNGTMISQTDGNSTLTKRHHNHPLKSFSVPAPPPQSAPSTPQQKHVVRPQQGSSPYKKLPQHNTPTCSGSPSSAGKLRSGPGTAEETTRLQPSYSTEELNQEMANLEGLMKDLNAITASEFEC